MAVCTRNPSLPPPTPPAVAPIWSHALQRRNLTTQSVSGGKPILISRDKDAKAICSTRTSLPSPQSYDYLNRTSGWYLCVFLIYDYKQKCFFCRYGAKKKKILWSFYSFLLLSHYFSIMSIFCFFRLILSIFSLYSLQWSVESLMS